ncbi:MAG: enoyl-CoA hydratase/isomerase family protein [Candidatus Methanofastidiosia archaeon]
MKYENLIFEVKENIGIVKINRPKRKNALNTETLKELKKVFSELDKSPEVRVVILTGVGNSFASGGDILEMSKMGDEELEEFGKTFKETFIHVERCRKPVIAAVNGYALGGGCELAECCDLRIASRNAKFGHLEVNMGVIGGTQRLLKLVSKGIAFEILYTGKIIDSREALIIGLVNKVFDENEFEREVFKIALEISSKSKEALEAMKKAANFSGSFDEGLEYEYKLFKDLFFSEEREKAMKKFLEK